MRAYFLSRRPVEGRFAALILFFISGACINFHPSVVKERERYAAGSGLSEEKGDQALSESRWRIQRLDDTKDRSGMTRELQVMAARDPEGALALAIQEADEESRRDQLQAVLRGWGGVDVESAGDWARLQDFMDRGLAMAAVFNGAVRQPSEAIGYALKISQEDPPRARDYGVYLIFALGQAGDHEKAAAFAASGNPDRAGDWITAAYNRWGQQDPERALASAVKNDAATRRDAFYAVISGWAQANPQTLVVHAVHFPAGAEKNYSLIAALRSWIGRDPGAAADWIEAHRRTVASIPGFETILED